MIRDFVLIIIASLSASSAGAATLIDWPELIDEAAQVYEDPFVDLNYDDIDDLRTIAKTRSRIESGKLEGEDRQKAEIRMGQALDRLAAANIDANWLLEQRWVVAEHRENAANAGNPEVDGTDIILAGFAIPAPPDEDGTPMNLVPQRGMCSHLPPPNPNQMVRARVIGGWTPSVMHEPVRLTGHLRIIQSRETIHVVDGPVDMIATFDMDVTGIETMAGLVEETSLPAHDSSGRWSTGVRGKLPAQTTKP